MRPLPRFIQIEPVGECNLRCRMCAIQFRTDGRPHGPAAFMPFERFTAIVDQFPGLRELQLQGLGEPFMHPRFFDMVRYASARGAEVSVNTNLSYMTERAAEECIASGLARLHASLDGATARTYERIRVRASFEKALRNLRRLIAARRAAGTAMPFVEITVVAMRENLGELHELVRLAASEGADAVAVQHLCHDFGEASLPAHYRPMRAFVEEQTLLSEAPDRVADAFARARAAAEAAGITLRLPSLHAPRAATGCSWPSTGMYFSYAGDVMPCCMIGTPDRFNFGVADERNLAEVWNGDGYERFRSALASDRPPEICSSCAVYNGSF